MGLGVHELEPACPPRTWRPVVVSAPTNPCPHRPATVTAVDHVEPLSREGRTGRAVGSIVTGVAFLAGFVGVASGSASLAVTLTFIGAVLLVCLWLSSTSVHLYPRLA